LTTKQHTTIDGVDVYWAPGPAPMIATLTFGCGVRDESLRTLGVTHLIEHLAMSTLPRLHHEHNATVGIEVTRFFATGKPAQLVDFIAAVCEALSDLPLSRIEKEAGVLTAEGSAVCHPTAGVLLASRYGIAGPGLAPWSVPGYDQIPAEAVTAHAAKFFTRGNAVLTLTGPPPEGLRLPLPDGPRAVHAPVPPRLAGGPRWLAENVPCAGLSLRGPSVSPVDALGLQVLSHRLTEVARTEKGLSYSIDGDRANADPSTTDRIIWVDAREGQEAEVASILWNTARELAVSGPTREELDHEVAGFREMVEDPRFVDGDLDEFARSVLLGEPYLSPAEWLEVLASTTPAQVAAAMTESLRTALIVVPGEARLELSDLDGAPVPPGGCATPEWQPEGKVFKPPLLARAINATARGLRLHLTPDGVALVDDGDRHFIRFADVVGVLAQNGSRTLFSRSGCVVPVDSDLFAGIEPVIAAIDARVDPGVVFPPSALA
jgi:predicted Zn-dependent peptidase